jgi:hypothetical protein
MSYCRTNGKSEIYAYHSIYDVFNIHVSNSANNEIFRGLSYEEKTAEDFLKRLNWLKRQGVYVPRRALDRIRAEIKNGRWDLRKRKK